MSANAHYLHYHFLNWLPGRMQYAPTFFSIAFLCYILHTIYSILNRDCRVAVLLAMTFLFFILISAFFLLFPEPANQLTNYYCVPYAYSIFSFLHSILDTRYSILYFYTLIFFVFVLLVFILFDFIISINYFFFFLFIFFISFTALLAFFICFLLFCLS